MAFSYMIIVNDSGETYVITDDQINAYCETHESNINVDVEHCINALIDSSGPEITTEFVNIPEELERGTYACEVISCDVDHFGDIKVRLKLNDDHPACNHEWESTWGFGAPTCTCKLCGKVEAD